MDSGLDKTLLQDNQIHTLRLVRTEGRLAVFFDSVPIPGWQSLKLENSITAVGWRPWRNTVHIQSLEADPKLSISYDGVVADGLLTGDYTLPVEYGGPEGSFELKVGHHLDPEIGIFIKGKFLLNIAQFLFTADHWLLLFVLLMTVCSVCISSGRKERGRALSRLMAGVQGAGHRSRRAL